MKFIALNSSTAKVETVIQVNAEHITYFNITTLPAGSATRLDLLSGEHIFVKENPTDILRLIQTQTRPVE